MLFKSYFGAEIATVFEPLADLRIAVFRDWPYLYEGNQTYERAYLQTYARAPRAKLFAVYDGKQLIGATTCIPLHDETPEVQKPFVDAGFNIASVFYFGESILLPAYRGLGLGHRFFDEREAHVLQFETYTTTCFCGVVRPLDHPMCPPDYQPLDAFWQKRGYQKAPDLQAQFDWPDIGAAQSSLKPMQYWLKKW